MKQTADDPNSLLKLRINHNSICGSIDNNFLPLGIQPIYQLINQLIL